MKQRTLNLIAISGLALALTACNEQSKTAEPAALDLTDENTKVAYAIGASAGAAMARNLETLDGTDITVDTAILARGFEDGVNKAGQLEEADLQKVMNDFRAQVNTAMQEKRKKEQEEQAKIAEENKGKGAAFLEENKAKEGVVTLESGLQYKVLTEGTGAQPTKTDRVKVHYKGTLTDGTQFDSSYDRGQPAQFGVTQVIKGWTEALQLMKVGAKWQLTIPAELAYGAASRPKIPGNSVLLFDVELLEIVHKEEQKEGDGHDHSGHGHAH